jgi:3-oxoacyl-[acyl-carrier protein] reductase
LRWDWRRPVTPSACIISDRAKLPELTEAELIATGTPVISLPGDLTDESQIAAIFEAIGQQPYPLKVLVNSASIMPKGSLLTLETAQWDETLSLNLRAPWLCARYAAPLMKAAGGGNIINMSDTGVRHTWTGYPRLPGE